MREQTVLQFCISLKRTFSNAITCTLINKYRKGAVIQTAAVFQTIFYLVC